MKFNNNEECAEALYSYLLVHNPDDCKYCSENDILLDINNLRGNEWLEIIDRNSDTRCFFDYIGLSEFHSISFVHGKAISPDMFLKTIFGKDFGENPTYDEVRSTLDNNGYDNLWDYSVEDMDEATINNDYLIAVAFYEPDGYSARLFELTEDMADKFFAEFYGVRIPSVDEMIKSASASINSQCVNSKPKILDDFVK